MKIIHSSGKEYSLSPGTHLEIQRPNPFFNDYGEQSLPVTLPPDDINRRLLVFPDDLTGINKTSQRTNALIQHGVFSIPCRQAVLSANKKTGIQTSFYLNTGAFYEKVKDVQLSTVFENKVIRFASVAEAISFCRQLFINHDNRFACFPVMLDTGYLNKLSGLGSDGYPRLYNDEVRSETVDEKTISLSPGFYITPFIRGLHLLEEIFSYFGYKLGESFFSRTSPFKDMVFLNNNIDTIVKGEIRYSQIVPDCMVNTILNVYRYRFNCEFIPDETTKTINIKLFDEVIRENCEVDLSGYVVGKYTVNHPAKFKQLKLSCERVTSRDLSKTNTTRPVRTVNKEDAGEEFETVAELLKKYPEAVLDTATGEFIRKGYKGVREVIQRLGYITLDYYEEGNFEVESKKAPDVSPEMVKIISASESLHIYIGPGRALNSTVVLGSSAGTGEPLQDSSDASELKPMLCFVARSANGLSDYGTIFNYDINGNKLWSYTLAYHGEDGLFERFWRNYDNLLRNSMLQVQADLLLTDAQKVSLSEYKKVMIDGQELLPDTLEFVVDMHTAKQCSFLTTKLYKPLSMAMLESTRLKPKTSPYKWEVHFTATVTNKRYWKFKQDPGTVFYDPPTEKEYQAGGQYHKMSYEAQFYNRSTSSGEPENPEDGILTVWFEPILNN